MTEFPTHVCEICGARKRKQSGWFLVTQDRWGDALRILFWSDLVASRPDAWAFCSSAHVQQFVGRWLASDYAIDADYGTTGLPGLSSGFGMTAQQEERLRDALIGELQISRPALSSGLSEERESALSILDAIEAVLEGYGSDVEIPADETVVFDA